MEIKLEDIVDIEHTIGKELFLRYDNFFEIIPNINEFILKLGNEIDINKFNKVDENIWIAKSVKLDESVKIIGPCIIDENTEIRHCAYIRGGVIIGKNCVIGNSCELKNSIIFDDCQIPHFNYIGDSILGYHSHIGAGVIVANLKNDKTNIVIRNGDKKLETGLRKMGAIIGNCVEIGCNSVVFPGTIIMSDVSVYPLTRVRGVIPKNSIVKSENEIILRRER